MRELETRQHASFARRGLLARANHGKLLVHLVNTAGPHTPVGPIQVALRSGSLPRRITLEPCARSLHFKHDNGETRFTVAEVPIHCVVVVE